MERGEATQHSFEPSSGEETTTDHKEHTQAERERVSNAIFFLTEKEFSHDIGMSNTFYSNPKESTPQNVLAKTSGTNKIQEGGRTIAEHTKIFVLYKEQATGKLIHHEIPSGQAAKDFITQQKESAVAAVSYWKKESEGSKGNMTIDGNIEWTFI